MNPIENPYTPGAGVRPPALVGRDTELDYFETAAMRMMNGLHDRSLLLSGLRGVGKTVLLNEFCSIAHRQNWVYQQIEACRELKLPQLVAGCLRNILLRLSAGPPFSGRTREALGVLKSFRERWHLPESGDVEVGTDPLSGRAGNVGDLQKDIGDLFVEMGEYARTRGSGVLITIDEAQELGQDQLEALMMGLHRTAQRQLPFMVVVAGLLSLPALAAEARPHAERFFAFFKVDSLPTQEAAKAMTVPAMERDISWDQDALLRVVDITAGYPYFLQEFGKHAWDFAAGPSRITLWDVESSVPEAVQSLDRGFFRVRYNRTTPAERTYLAAMARHGAGPHPSGEVASALGKTTPQVAMHRNSLITKGLCYVPRYGEIAFTVPMFDQFIRRRMGFSRELYNESGESWSG